MRVGQKINRRKDMYTFDTRVSYSKIDRTGKVPMYEIMNYLQDCSTFQSEELHAGIDFLNNKNKAWVIIAYKIKFIKPLSLGQEITVGTAPVDFGKVFASRNYCIKEKDGEYLIKADAIWMMIDTQTRKAMRIQPEDYAVYTAEEGFDDVKAGRRIKLQGQGVAMPEFKVLRTYVDHIGHMNNANYLRIAEEYLPEGFQCSELEIVYSKEALQGQTVTPYMYNEEDGIGLVFENQQGELLTKMKFIK